MSVAARPSRSARPARPARPARATSASGYPSARDDEPSTPEPWRWGRGAPGPRGTWAEGRRSWWVDLTHVLPAWLAARVLVTLGYVLAVSVVHASVPDGRTGPINEQLMAWDGTFYRDISVVGYPHLPQEALRFFPLYPLLGRLGGSLLLGHDTLALLLIANASALIALVLLRRLVLLETGDALLAERSVWLLALFPSAFVLVWGYAEALMLMLCVGAFLAMRTRRWELAAVLGLLAALTRPTGVLLAVPIAYEAWRGFGRATLTDRLGRVLAVVAPVAGLALYLGWVGRHFGDSLLPMTIQNGLRGQQVDPVTRLVRGVGDLFGPERFGDGLHAPFAIALVVLVVLTFRYWPRAYGLFAALVVVVALSADNLNSIERYGLNAFPVVLALASITAAKRAEWLALAVCACGVVALSALAWLAIYVP